MGGGGEIIFPSKGKQFPVSADRKLFHKSSSGNVFLWADIYQIRQSARKKKKEKIFNLHSSANQKHFYYVTIRGVNKNGV